MIERLDRSSGTVLGFRISGQLHDADYEHFVPVLDAAIREHGQVRLLAWLDDFQGWDAAALWDDVKFAAGHYSAVEKVALVGDKKWEEWMATVCKPFTAAAVKYFDQSQVDEAWAWAGEGA